MPSVPWEDRRAGSSSVLWRSSRNPIVTREQVPRANSIFNSAVVPLDGGFAGIFRVDDTRRVMNVHAGRSDDGVEWRIEPEPIVFEVAETVSRRCSSGSSTRTTPASPGWKTVST
jgi:beta-1,4-mannooligosaccharide/beta-1,4-mannosyl-N-acetylglucosamine phosphorylase